MHRTQRSGGPAIAYWPSGAPGHSIQIVGRTPKQRQISDEYDEHQMDEILNKCITNDKVLFLKYFLCAYTLIHLVQLFTVYVVMLFLFVTANVSTMTLTACILKQMISMLVNSIINT